MSEARTSKWGTIVTTTIIIIVYHVLIVIIMCPVLIFI